MGDLLPLLRQPQDILRELQILGERLPAEFWPGTAAAVAAVLDVLRATQTRQDPLLFEEKGLAALKISGADLDAAYQQITQEDFSVLEAGITRLEALYRPQLPRAQVAFGEGEQALARRFYPYRRIGIYLCEQGPCLGNLLRQAVAARVAGVRERVLVLDYGEKIPPQILVAAQLTGIEEIYRLSGARAIAALAYGAPPLAPVECITGVGPPEAMLAKQLLSPWVRTDSPQARLRSVAVVDNVEACESLALDLLTQAHYHPQGSQAALTADPAVAQALQDWLRRHHSRFDWGVWTEKALAHYGTLVLVESLKEAPSWINALDPDVLTLAVAQPWDWVEKIRRAQTILISPQTPRAALDYGGASPFLLAPLGFDALVSRFDLSLYLKSAQIIDYGNHNSASLTALRAHDRPFWQA
ncbi:MAG: histidinol dehydrogenase [Cyanobacteria bacterium RI_101]|nr:histidinol dehydrogenase [Cyanobacteria bacterium RI_101]